MRKRLAFYKWDLASMAGLAVMMAALFSPLTMFLGAEALGLLRAGVLLFALGVLLPLLMDPGRPSSSASVSADVWPSMPPLFPLRVCFTLCHSAPSDLIALPFGPPSGHSGIAESPVTRPVEMTIDIHSLARRDGARRAARLQRSFARRQPVEVTRVHRRGDVLYQDYDVVQWKLLEGAGEAWSLEHLVGATVRVTVTCSLVDDDEVTRPPRLHDLHLYFGETSADALFFTEEQLASPMVTEERAPRKSGDRFGVLVLEYVFVLTADLLDRQLVRVVAQPGLRDDVGNTRRR